MGEKVNTEVGAAMCGVTPGTFKFWRHVKKGPKFIKLGTSKQAGVCYDVDDIEAWLAERKFSSTTECSAAARASTSARNTHMPPPRGAVLRPWEKTTV